jgi:transcriptional regulator with XRE-family HTH domain
MKESYPVEATIPRPLQGWDIITVPRRRLSNEDIGPLARLLRRLRGQSGLSQVEIARRAGWEGNSYYSALETGAIREPGKDKVRQLEEAFGVSEGEIERVVPRQRFLGDDEPPYDLPGGGAMEIDFLPGEIVIRHPDPSLRRTMQHIQEAVHDEADQLSLELSILAWRQQRAEEEAMERIVERSDSGERTNERA